jgi:autophagy-related protein 17
MAAPRSGPSSGPRSRPTSYHDPPAPEFDADDVPVEVLVRHLLAAKQSLSSMALVLRAHDLATNARQMHEESVILSAQTGALRQLIEYQVRLLRRVRRVMGRAYDFGRRDFKQLIRALDAANGKLEKTMQMLRDTHVERIFRPPGEEDKSLMDFVDENSVEAMRDALKASIAELQVSQRPVLCRVCDFFFRSPTMCRLRRHPSTATSSASTTISACSTRP